MLINSGHNLPPLHFMTVKIYNHAHIVRENQVFQAWVARATRTYEKSSWPIMWKFWIMLKLVKTSSLWKCRDVLTSADFNFMPCGGMGILLTDYVARVYFEIDNLKSNPKIVFARIWVYQSTYFEVKLEKMKLEYIVIMVNASIVRNKGMDCEPFLV